MSLHSSFHSQGFPLQQTVHRHFASAVASPLPQSSPRHSLGCKETAAVVVVVVVVVVAVAGIVVVVVAVVVVELL